MTAKETAYLFKGQCATTSFSFQVRNDVLEVNKTFIPGDVQEYAEVEREAYSLFSLIKRTRPGSIWGSTSDGIGGMASVQSGNFRLCASGLDKRVLKQLGGVK